MPTLAYASCSHYAYVFRNSDGQNLEILCTGAFYLYNDNGYYYCNGDGGVGYRAVVRDPSVSFPAMTRCEHSDFGFYGAYITGSGLALPGGKMTIHLFGSPSNPANYKAFNLIFAYYIH
jgi:hypothetical protein